MKRPKGSGEGIAGNDDGGGAGVAPDASSRTDEGTHARPRAIEAWAWKPHDGVLREVIDAWDGSRPVEFREGGKPAVTDAIESGGRLPTAGMVPNDCYRQALRDGVFADVGSAVAPHEDDVYPIAESLWCVDGTWYGVPTGLGPLTLVCNTAVFAAAGLPTDPVALEERLETWRDWLDVAERLRTRTGADFGFGTFYARTLLQQFGGGWYDESGALRYDQPANVAAVSLLSELDEYLSGEWFRCEEGRRAFREGDVASVLAPIWWVTRHIPDAFPDLECRVVRTPKAVDGLGVHGGNHGGAPATVPANLPTDLAMDAAAFAGFWHLSDEGFAAKVRNGFLPPVDRPDGPGVDRKFEYYGGQTLYPRMMAAVRDLPPTRLAPSQAVSDLHRRAVAAVLDEGRPVEETLAAFHEQMVPAVPETDRSVDVSAVA